jgi:hypothetical protein
MPPSAGGGFPAGMVPRVSKGATFERPIMNYVSLWEIEPERR